MEIDSKPGKYIVAVSGGVDSMALLDLLVGQPGLELVVAHFEHGIRPDSDDDRRLVESAAKRYGLPFIYERGELGAGASEAAARDARYAFLRRVQVAQGADAIMTAHHQDDLLETAIINMIRGTGSRGLSSLRTTPEIVRPLLHVPKQSLAVYAKHHHLVWHEDSTNSDESYLRNRVRRRVVTAMSAEQRQTMLSFIARASVLNDEIDVLISEQLASQHSAEGYNRQWFIGLPYAVSLEVLAVILRTQGAKYDRRRLNLLTVFAKVGEVGKHLDVDANYYVEIRKKHIALTPRTSLRSV